MNKRIIIIGLLVLLFIAVLLFFAETAWSAQTKHAKNTLDAYAPFEEVLQVTPSDVTTYDPPFRGCLIEADGDLVITPVKNASGVTITVIAGQLVPALISQVNSGTTATVACGR